jgi:transposase
VVCCYEAGRDGFWLHRLLAAQDGVTCYVLDPASLPVDRRARRAKSDRIDVRMLLRAVIAYESGGGDRQACRPVRVPTLAEEDAKRLHRERAVLIRERIRHVNRIQALLATQGVSGFAPLRPGSRAQLSALRRGDGSEAPLPPALLAAIGREFDRLELVCRQIAELEAARDTVVREAAAAATPASDGPAATVSADPDPVAAKIARLVEMKGIGAQLATVLGREVFYRSFANRREVAAYAGLCACPWRSGGMAREQGISKAGNPQARTAMIELAWLWLRWQPESALARWFTARVGTAMGRVRRIAIVALARKLLVALWRYLETGLVPEGAVTKTVGTAA